MSAKSIRVSKDRSIDLSGSSIELVVGETPAVTLSVHENLVCAASGFFRTATKQEWMDGHKRSITFGEDDPDIFLLYLHWLYTRTLPVRIDKPGADGNAEYIQLAKAYVLGDKLQDGDFQDVVIDTIVEKCKSKAHDGASWHPVGAVFEQIYNNTVETSKARRLLVDIYVAHGSGRWLLDWVKPDEIPKDFLLDLSLCFLDRKRNDPSTKSSLCEYHQHASEPSLCYRNHLRD